MKNKVLIAITTLIPFISMGQTNPPVINTNIPPSIQQALSMNPISLLESYIVDNDTNYNGWLSNHFSLWQAAVFSTVHGVPGASAVGNDMGLEVPVYKHALSVDSVTRFEQLFGDIHSQQIGVSYSYNMNQIQLSAGLDGRYNFIGHHLEAVPYVELKKASTLLHGVGTILRYSFPIQKNAGGGEVEIGAVVSF